MPNRAQRRAAARQQADVAAAAQTLSIQLPPGIPQAGLPHPPLESLSPRTIANRQNAKHSTGPKPTSFSITSQNRTTHGLARHNGAFKLLASEDPAGFEALKQSLIDEHKPSTPTEFILVHSMAESHWLANRAQTLTETCLDPTTGQITDEKRFALYLRYQTTHTRVFHKSLNDLVKLRSEKRKEELGFEAQRIQSERHEMKKQHHYWDILRKDGQANHQIIMNCAQFAAASEKSSGFEAQYAAELAKRALKTDYLNGALAPAAA